MLQACLMLLDTEDEKEKFMALYNKYIKLMHYRATEILQDRHLVEDAVQESLIRIAKAFHGIGEIDSAETKHFVMIIVEHIALDLLEKETGNRDNVSLDSILEEELESIPSSILDVKEDTVFSSVTYNLLVEEIMRLPEMYREVIYLYAAYGFSLSDIAVLLDISYEAAKKRLQRGRKLLVDKLEKWQNE